MRTDVSAACYADILDFWERLSRGQLDLSTRAYDRY